MYELRLTAEFRSWLYALADSRARARIVQRIERFEMGNPGDVVPVGDGVSEMRIHYGPGYRVYYMQSGRTVYVLLCAGDKSTQSRDIKLAKAMAKELRQ